MAALDFWTGRSGSLTWRKQLAAEHRFGRWVRLLPLRRGRRALPVDYGYLATRLGRWRILPVAGVVTLLSGCSMSAEYFVHKSLMDAGFSRAEARCAVDGVAGQLNRDQLGALRPPLLRYVMLDEPASPMNLDQLLAWLRPEVSPEIHHVVSHYAAQCRV